MDKFSFKQLTGLAIGNFGIGTSALVVAGLINTMSRDFGTTGDSIAALITIYSVTYAFCSPLASILVSKFDQKKVLALAVIVFAIGNYLSTIGDSLNFIYFARVLTAVGASIFTPVSSLVAATISPKELIGKSISIVFGGLTVATVLGVPIGSFLAASFDWRYAFYLVVFMSVVSLVSIKLLLPNSIQTKSQTFKTLLRVMTNSRKALQLSLTVIQMMAQFSIFALISPYIIERFGVDEKLISSYLLAFGISSFIGTVLGGIVVDKIGSSKSLKIALLGLLLSFVAIYYTPNASILYLSIGFWGFFGFAFHPIQQVELLKLDSENASAMLSLNASAIYLGTALGTEVAKYNMSQGHIFNNPVIALLLAFIGLLISAGIKLVYKK